MEARIRERARARQAEDSLRAGRAPQHRRLLGCGREQQRKAGMVGGRSRGLRSGERRQEERGMGGSVGRGAAWPKQKVRLHD